jgi:hypothetical protein
VTAQDESLSEIGKLELFVQTGAEKMGGTPYLSPPDARKLLEKIAHRRVVTGRPVEMVDLALKSSQFVWPPELSEVDRRRVVGQLIGDSGIVITDDDGFRFTRREAETYLAAWHIVRRHPRGPRRWPPGAARYFAPQPKWSQPESELTFFLAALYWPQARRAVERSLCRLLDKRHLYPNVDLVIELLQHDVLPGSDFHERTAESLRQALGEDSLPEEQWSFVAGRLHLLDPATAVITLDNFIRTPLEAMPPQRRFLAVIELAKHEPERAAKNLEILAVNLTGRPEDRLKTAFLISGYSPEQGVRAMLQLARTADMRDLRVDAAIASGSLDLMREFVEHGRGLADSGRLRLVAALLERDLDLAVSAAERFASNAAGDTPLRVANLLAPRAQQAALRIAVAVAWPAGSSADSELRLRAVILIGEIDSAQAIPTLDQLSKESSVTAEIQLRAASLIVTEHQGPITALVDFAENPALAKTLRAKAAKKAGQVDPITGARLLIAIATTDRPTRRDRLELLKAAYGFDPEPAAEALAELAKERIDDTIRLEAVEIAGPKLTKARRIALYSDIATNAKDNDAAMTAARKVLAAEEVQGRRLMATVAMRKGASDTFRLTAALEGGSAAAPALRDLALNARPDTLRLKASQALKQFDSTDATKALQRLIKNSSSGSLRIEAALSLPGRAAVDSLVDISRNPREKEKDRLQAALKANEQDSKRGQQALDELVRAPHISAAVKQAARKHLKK